jgi:DNA processing protein
VTDLFSQAIPGDFEARAVVPARELGAYEAIWAREGTSFKTIADMFRAQPGTVPSDFAGGSETETYSRIALGAIRAAGIKHFGIRVHGAGEYPEKLRDAQHPVELLYFQGNWDLTASRCVAIVGTRTPSEDGLRRTAKLSRLFTENGFTVVSGLAQGVDTAAHTAATEAGGRTIAVLGTPITSCYPSANIDLQKRIADQFLVISQVPIVRYSRQGPQGNRLFFPERNATMSALMEATVIVEAGNTSGTLIQARHALQQRRKLFILESCFRNPQLTWPAKFLERGAIRVTEFEEIKAHLAS